MFIYFVYQATKKKEGVSNELFTI